MKLNYDEIIKIILQHHPKTQAIYLFGSYAFGQENKNSDVDIAILLPHDEAKKILSFTMSKVLSDLSSFLTADNFLLSHFGLKQILYLRKNGDEHFH